MLAPANSHHVEPATPPKKEDLDLLFDGNRLGVGSKLRQRALLNYFEQLHCMLYDQSKIIELKVNGHCL